MVDGNVTVTLVPLALATAELMTCLGNGVDVVA